MPDPQPPRKNPLRRWALPAIAVVLVAYFVASTDLPKVLAAIRQANLALFGATAVVVALTTWVYDSWCLTWLIGATLGHRGNPQPVKLGAILPIKGASYLLNIVNYHAAALGMAYLVGRRKGVPYLEAAGAMATLSYIDLVAVTAMAMVGVWLAPDFFGPYPALQAWLKMVAAAVFAGALVTALLLQSKLEHPLLSKLRQFAPLRPISALGPRQMLAGLGLRTVLIVVYAATTYAQMAAFGLHPVWGRIFVAVPILTVVGTIPISVSGFGSTQVLMRSFYAPFVAAGLPAVATIDGFSTLYIASFIVVRLFIAAPFFRAISRELQERPDAID
ncbi:MAG: flippase-like domain-containing protein [Deltaproteobacteria bacterium]|nr:flippase-like domain-containing protein [Deltaproteobacteria bacterium]